MTLIGPVNDHPPRPLATTQDERRATGAFGTVLDARGGRPAAEGCLADTHSAADPLMPSSQADVFNAEGFFQGPTEMPDTGRSIATGAVASTLPVDPLARAVHAATAPTIPTLQAQMSSSSSMAGRMPGQPDVSVPGVSAPLSALQTMQSSRASAALTAVPASVGAMGAAPSATSADRQGPADAGIGAGRRLFARMMTARGTAMATRVALTAVEQGIQVAIHVDGLAPEERVRLRDRVLAMLSRHGLAAQLRFDGTPDTTPILPARGR